MASSLQMKCKMKGSAAVHEIKTENIKDIKKKLL